jgi:cysteine synthase B
MITSQIDINLLQKARKLAPEVGGTPLVRLERINRKKGVELWAKQEWKQISGSVKCRAAYRIIVDALEKGQLDQDRILLDATSGNTGIAYAAIGAKIGLRVALCLPENASDARKNILQSLGAEIIFTSRFEGTDGAQEKARQLAREFPEKYFYADQYKNHNNWKAHYHTTAEEIISELPDLTHFVAGLGTSGTFMGTGKRLKEYRNDIQLVSFQPDSALHGLEGWKHMETALVPAIYNPTLADSSFEVSTEEAFEMIRRAWVEERIKLSPSSAANLAGAMKLIDTINEGIVVTVLPDNADKYEHMVKKILHDQH